MVARMLASPPRLVRPLFRGVHPRSSIIIIIIQPALRLQTENQVRPGFRPLWLPFG